MAEWLLKETPCGRRMVSATISAQRPDLVQKGLEQYLKEYPPCGYGTTYGEIAEHEEEWIVHINRSACCD